MCTNNSSHTHYNIVITNYVSVVDSIHNKGGVVKTWIQKNIRRIQDGLIGVFSGMFVTNTDVSVAISIVIVAAVLAIFGYVIGVR